MYFGRLELSYIFLVYAEKYVIFTAKRGGKYVIIRGKMLEFWVMTVWTSC